MPSFIVLEGIDGTGKSTHAGLLAERLKGMGEDVFLTSEPTGGEIGSLIRKVLSGDIKVGPKALALLFTADRMQHMGDIRRALDSKRHVICERYYHSTVAYQAAQGVKRQWLLDINSFCLKPDMVFLLDLDSESAQKRTSTGEIFEKSDFLRDVRRQYMLFDGLIQIDSLRPIDEVADILAKKACERIFYEKPQSRVCSKRK